MKKIFFAVFMLIAVGSFANSTTDTIKVYGNCDGCKKHIEKASKEAGAATANWDEDTRLLVVSYDADKTSNIKIQEKVAAAGYDTQDVKADDAAYKKLDKCCQYKRKVFADSTESKQ